MLPTRASATTSAAAAAEPAKAAAEAPSARSTAEPADDHHHDKAQDDERDRNRRAVALACRARDADAVERDVATLRDAPDDALGAKTQSIAEPARAELGRHHLAARFAREPVGDPLLEAVSALDSDAPFLH